MDANTRHFEAELEAQHEETVQQARQIHADAEVVSATAL
jgi:hypothetical protein